MKLLAKLVVIKLSAFIMVGHTTIPECLTKRVDVWEKVYTKYDKDEALVLDKTTMEILEIVLYPEKRSARKTLLKKMQKKYPGIDIRLQQGISSKFEEGMQRYESGLGDIVHRDVKAAGLPIEIALLPHVESSYNPKAMSKVKATGLFQIMPFWAKELGLKTYKQLKDPEISTKAAIKLMKMKHSEIGYWPLTITAWNQGVNAMSKAQSQFGNDICAVTERYEGKRFGFSGKNFYATLLAVEKIVEERQSPTWLRYKKRNNDTMP